MTVVSTLEQSPFSRRLEGLLVQMQASVADWQQRHQELAEVAATLQDLEQLQQSPRFSRMPVLLQAQVLGGILTLSTARHEKVYKFT
jgi:hypothetical protein